MFQTFMTSEGFDLVTLLVLCGIGLGTFLAVYGVGRGFMEKTPAAIRIAGHAKGPTQSRRGDLIKLAQAEPTGVLGAFSPETETERFQISEALARAGFRGANAVGAFYLVRLLLAVGLPGAFIGLLALSHSGATWLPDGLRSTLNGFSTLFLIEILAVLVAAGFFGPTMWLSGLINARKQRIEEAFPNALDLIQIAVEAGLGFDAAMTRVATEIHSVAPDISQEMLTAQNEIQAGRDRDRALLDMGRRTGVEEVASFASVVLQSMQFGTPISDALTTYAEEMRVMRELKAQEKANKLPVQMSAVLASLMLPAILLLTLGPVVIRYVNYFAAQ